MAPPWGGDYHSRFSTAAAGRSITHFSLASSSLTAVDSAARQSRTASRLLPPATSIGTDSPTGSSAGPRRARGVLFYGSASLSPANDSFQQLGNLNPTGTVFLTGATRGGTAVSGGFDFNHDLLPDLVVGASSSSPAGRTAP